MRRVAVTGLGLVTPLGVGCHETWAALCRGESAAAPITLFDATPLTTRFACEVKAFDPTRWLPRPLVRRTDRFIQLALVATLLARDDAALSFDAEEAPRVGVALGSGMGGIRTLEATHTSLQEKGQRRGVSPYFVPSIIVNLAAGQASILLGARGPNIAPAAACSAGAHALGEALRCIQYGEADVMVAGGAECCVSALAMAGFGAMRALSRRNDDPARACRPFDRDRDGFVMGEGAGVLVLEALSRARARGVRVYAELVGYGRNADAHHITAPSPGGEGARRCMELALRDAGVAPHEVDYINAHGTSTPQNDAIEVRAIRGVFGAAADRLAVSSTKSMTGHLLGASGGLETAVCALALRGGIIPPTINLEHPDPACDLDLVPNQAREAPVRVAMTNSFGFGGTNAVLVLRRDEETP